MLEFAWGTDMDLAGIDVREKLDLLQLPLEAKRPLLLRFDPSSEPVMRLAFTDKSNATTADAAQARLRDLRRFADDRLKPELESVEGSAAVKVSGGYEDEIQIHVDQQKLAQLGLSIDAVTRRLRAENVNLSGGRLEQGTQRFLVRTLNEFQSIEQMANAIIATVGGRPVYLRDVARVAHGHKDREAITRVNGRECIELAVYKEGDANTVQLADGVRKKLEQIEKAFPAQAELVTVYDQSRFIGAAIGEVKFAAVLGGLLAIVVLYLFLRDARTTFITSVAIPVSVVGTFMLMYMSDLSLNIMSLGGLALAVGMLVDNAVVVLEAIVRKREHGHSRVEAAQLGHARSLDGRDRLDADLRRRVLPDGVRLRHRRPAVPRPGADGHVLAAALARGRVDAGADARGGRRSGKGRQRHADGARQSRSAESPPPCRRQSARCRSRCGSDLANDGAAVPPRRECNAVALPVLRAALPAGYPLGADASDQGSRRRARAVPAHDADRAAARQRAGPADLARRVQHRPAPCGRHAAGSDRPGGLARADVGRATAGPRPLLRRRGHRQPPRRQPVDAGENTGRVSITLGHGATREDEERAIAQLRDSLQQMPGVQHQFSRPSLFALSTPLEVVITGYDLERLSQAAERVHARMLATPLFRDVRSTVEAGNPEIQIVFDQERATQLGLAVRDIADRVVQNVRGEVATRYRLNDKKIDVLVRSVDTRSASIEEIRRLIVNPGSERPVPLTAVADVDARERPGGDPPHRPGARRDRFGRRRRRRPRHRRRWRCRTSCRRPPCRSA